MSKIQNIENLMLGRASLHIAVYDANIPMHATNHLDGKKTAEQILAKYTSIEEYLKSFYVENEREALYIQLRRKNGSTFRRAELTERISFEKPTAQIETPATTPIPAVATIAPVMNDKVIFLGGGVEKHLKLDEYLQLLQAKAELERVIEEKKILKKATEKTENLLEAKIEKQKNKFRNLKQLYKQALDKSKLNDKLGVALEKGLPFLMDKFSQSGALSGAKAKDSLDGLSTAKKAFFNEILKEEQVSDEILETLKYVTYLIATKPEAYAEVNEIINKHKTTDDD